MNIKPSRSPFTPDAVVMVAILPSGLFAPTASWRDEHDQDLLDEFAEVLESVQDETGDIIEVSTEMFVAVFDDDELAAAHAATDLQQWLATRGEPARIGIGGGSLRSYVARSSSPSRVHPFVTGPAPSRARALAAWARPGALLLDTAVVAQLAVEYLRSDAGTQAGWSDVDYLGPVAEMPRRPDIAPIAYNELLWSGAGLQEGRAAPSGAEQPAERRLRGTVARVPRGEQLGRIEPLDDTELPHVFRSSSVVDDDMMAEGSMVFFSPGPPGKRHELPDARMVLRIGARLTGRVRKVFSSRHYAFVEVGDGDGGTHTLFMHADDNEWPVAVDDLVSFTVGENRQGPTVTDAVVVD